MKENNESINAYISETYESLNLNELRSAYKHLTSQVLTVEKLIFQKMGKPAEVPIHVL